MITAEEFLRDALTTPIPTVQSQPTVVYVPASPRRSGRRWFMGLLMLAPIAAVTWGLSSGEISISQEGVAALPHITVVAVATQAPFAVPTAYVVPPAPAVPVAPITVQQPIVAQPVPPPVAATVAPVILNQAIDIPAAVVPAAVAPAAVQAPAPLVCTVDNATYTVYRTITSGGVPVAQLTGISCISLADAESQADAQEAAIRADLIAKAAQSNVPVVLDAPLPTPGMGPGGGGGGTW